MIPRRLSSLMQVPVTQRDAVLAEGLSRLAENVATFAADAKDIGKKRRDRSAAVLNGFAEEEAAKVLILLDLVRAGWSDIEAVKRCLSGFYDHLARGLYVRAYSGEPADLADVRRYVGAHRQEYYLDGPSDVDWMFRNDILESREGQLYVDYVEDEDGNKRWTGPADHAALHFDPYSFPPPIGTVVRLVRAMNKIGLLTAEGLTATQEAWAGVVVDDKTHWQDVQPLNIAVFDKLIAGGVSYTTSKQRRRVGFVLEHWTFPLTSIDLRLAPVDKAKLRADGDAWFAAQLRDY